MTNTQRLDPELDLLLKMRERLSDEGNWCAGLYQNGEGQSCLVGAYMYAVGIDLFRIEPTSQTLDSACDGAAELLGITNVPLFNDTHTHPEVLDLLDRAIAERTSELNSLSEV